MRVARQLNAARKVDWRRSAASGDGAPGGDRSTSTIEAQQRAVERFASEANYPFSISEDPDEQSFRDALSDAMATLPEDQRAVAHLRLWEGLTFSEIGEILTISPNTATSRYRYALNKLQGSLRALYEEIR
jgi:RNA polymerase sigma-70 factor (ECF subfamily)